MSKLELEQTDNIALSERTYVLHIPDAYRMAVKLDDFDQLLLDDIQQGEPSKTPIADKLLGLETLVRRMEEQAK